MEPEYDDNPDDTTSSELPSVVKLLIMAASLGLASIAGFYVHPHLLPLVTESIPQMWSAVQGWFTLPILFLLLNVVVATLYFSSSLLSNGGGDNKQARKRHRTVPARPVAAAAAAHYADRDKQATRSKEEEEEEEEKEEEAAPPPPSRPPSTGLRARIERSRTFGRLVRSKSEQIPPVSLAKGEAAEGSRLKKAGTFEGATGAQSRKPVVIVADPPEDEPDAAAGGDPQEVDKKAEDFISRFYQRVKLQRLESLLRQQRAAAN